jgi:hypothetical protein
MYCSSTIPLDPALEVERAVQVLAVYLPELRDRPYLTVTKVIAVWSDGSTSIEEAPPAGTPQSSHELDSIVPMRAIDSRNLADGIRSSADLLDRLPAYASDA